MAGPNVSAEHCERAAKIAEARAEFAKVRESILSYEEMLRERRPNEIVLPNAVELVTHLLTAQERLCDIVEHLVKESGST